MVQKRKRTSRAAKGTHGARKHPLPQQELVRMGKGMELESFGEPDKTYRKWYEALQRKVELRWEAQQRKESAA